VYASTPSGLQPLAPPRLCRPDDLAAWLATCLPALPPPQPGQPALLLAGNVFAVYPALADSALPGLNAERLEVLPTASALLRLSPGLMAAGAAVSAQDALPLYVRDKVAQTTAEREHLRSASPNAVVAGTGASSA
jgi:tRNA threonylcarbamoyladenosine biosynthesis protein TsaB